MKKKREWARANGLCEDCFKAPKAVHVVALGLGVVGEPARNCADCLRKHTDRQLRYKRVRSIRRAASKRATQADLALTHLNLDVRDLASAARFYGDVLGLPVERRDGSLAIRHSSFLLVLALGEPRVGGSFHFGFRVPTRDDVDAWVRRVRAMGVPVLIEPRQAAAVYVARVADPDAYEIEIYADVVDEASAGSL